jgi:hypothetical protein
MAATTQYQYDTGTTHHTTNEIARLIDIEKVNIPVEAHDGSISYCAIKGTLVLQHNGREIRLEDCLYDSKYSNLISGQRMKKNHTLEINNHGAQLKVGQRIIYKMTRDTEGGLWVKPDEGGKINKSLRSVKDMHERYGHISYNTLKKLPECPNFQHTPRCEACEKGKTTKPAAKDNPKRGIPTI